MRTFKKNHLYPSNSLNNDNLNNRAFLVACNNLNSLNTECKYGFYTCANKQNGFCETCEDGDNYEFDNNYNNDKELL
jgi:hypothetical protein